MKYMNCSSAYSTERPWRVQPLPPAAPPPPAPSPPHWISSCVFCAFSASPIIQEPPVQTPAERNTKRYMTDYITAVTLCGTLFYFLLREGKVFRTSSFIFFLFFSSLRSVFLFTAASSSEPAAPLPFDLSFAMDYLKNGLNTLLINHGLINHLGKRLLSILGFMYK